MKQIQIYDTTLRDGSQAQDISFSVEDKLLIAQKLDLLGIHYIEGGWPGANPKDTEFFDRARSELHLRSARLVAFGSTRRADLRPEDDLTLKSLLSSKTKTICLFGKSWDFHVHSALRVSLKKNLELIEDSVAFLKSFKREIIYDAEHFFDGYKANKKYALQSLDGASKGGADILVLCDTNGGSLPHEITNIVKEVKRRFKIPLGIHCHNDSGVAVANSIAAVQAGVVHVQGTMNGLGERCGNANLCSVIVNLELKMGYKTVGPKPLMRLRDVSRYVDETANRAGDPHQAYVGDFAFAHKGGVHVHAMLKDARTYEHLNPKKVGNRRKIVVSDLSGMSTMFYKVRELGIDMKKNSPETAKLLEKLKHLENHGYQFEGAEASFEIFVKKELGSYKPHFILHGFRVTDEVGSTLSTKNSRPSSQAEIRVSVEGHEETARASGVGPVHALDCSLRSALERFYPALKEVRLIDYKVRVLAGVKGTASSVRVLIECGDDEKKWVTVGVSENIIQASYMALVDSIDYKLMTDSNKSTP